MAGGAFDFFIHAPCFCCAAPVIGPAGMGWGLEVLAWVGGWRGKEGSGVDKGKGKGKDEG